LHHHLAVAGVRLRKLQAINAAAQRTRVFEIHAPADMYGPV
jgi:hypothetical protein